MSGGDQAGHADANARLIATAPELLEVARDVAAFLRTVYWNDDTSETNAADLGVRLQDVIEKAEG